MMNIIHKQLRGTKRNRLGSRGWQRCGLLLNDFESFQDPLNDPVPDCFRASVIDPASGAALKYIFLCETENQKKINVKC